MFAALMQSSPKKLVFANQLKGTAATAVMLSYLGGVLVLSSATPSWIISTPALNLGTPFILYRTRFTRLSFGPFGAAVFFLIDGFVIPFSLKKYAWGGFLISRAFRIFDGLPMAFVPRIYIRNAILPVVTVNYFYAFVIFALAFCAQGYFRPLRALITFMIDQRGMSHDTALPIAVGFIIGLAWTIHVAVERPSQDLGKRVACITAAGGGLPITAEILRRRPPTPAKSVVPVLRHLIK